MLTIDVALLIIGKYGFTVTSAEFDAFVGSDNIITAYTFYWNTPFQLYNIADVKRYINHLNRQQMRKDNPRLHHVPKV